MYFANLDKYSPHVTDFYTNFKKETLPPKPRLPMEGIELKFYDKEFRDRLETLLKDALKAKHWLTPLKLPQ